MSEQDAVTLLKKDHAAVKQLFEQEEHVTKKNDSGKASIFNEIRAALEVHAIIEGKRISLTLEEARELARRALKFKQERGRLPEITSPDAWEKRMAEGIEFLRRHAVGSPNG